MILKVIDEPGPYESFKIGGIEAADPEVQRMSVLIWGPSGFGKSTLAATMPGRKCWLSFDPDGTAVIAQLPDVTVYDFAKASDSVIAKMTTPDGFGLSRVMNHFDSFIVDSTTSISERTLDRGILKTKGATIERPSPGAYMARNNVLMAFVRDVLLQTAKHMKHVCFIAHEGAPQLSDEGNVINYTLALGGQLPNAMAIRINEVWACFETTRNEKYILVRKARLRSPAKSRMFITTSKDVEFQWKFNPEDWNHNQGMRISDWYSDWERNGFQKIPLPK